MPETEYSIDAGCLDVSGSVPTNLRSFSNGDNPVTVGQFSGDAFYGLLNFVVNQNRFATISSAILSLKFDSVTSGAFDIVVYGVAADNQGWPATPADAYPLIANRTTAVVVFGLPAVGMNMIDVTSVVQELVNRSGWVPGNKQMLVVSWAPTGNSGQMRTPGTSMDGPILVMDGTGGDGGDGGGVGGGGQSGVNAAILLELIDS